MAPLDDDEEDAPSNASAEADDEGSENGRSAQFDVLAWPYEWVIRTDAEML